MKTPALLLAVIAIPCTGCFDVQLDDLAKDPPVKQRYLFDVPLPEPVDAVATKRLTLRLSPAHAMAPYNGRVFVYRTGANTHTTDYYNEFLISPADQFSQITRAWLRSTRSFADVVDGDSPLAADLTLDMDITELRGDFRVAGDARARFAIRVHLLRTGPSVAIPESLLEKGYEAEVAIPSATPQALIEGWSKCAAEMLAELARDLAPFGGGE